MGSGLTHVQTCIRHTQKNSVPLVCEEDYGKKSLYKHCPIASACSNEKPPAKSQPLLADRISKEKLKIQ